MSGKQQESKRGSVPSGAPAESSSSSHSEKNPPVTESEALAAGSSSPAEVEAEEEQSLEDLAKELELEEEALLPNQIAQSQDAKADDLKEPAESIFLRKTIEITGQIRDLRSKLEELGSKIKEAKDIVTDTQ